MDNVAREYHGNTETAVFHGLFLQDLIQNRSYATRTDSAHLVVGVSCARQLVELPHFLLKCHF